MTLRRLRERIGAALSADFAIRTLNEAGLLCHQITQLDDGTWRVSCRVWPATPALARDPIYTDLGIGPTPLAAFRAMIASNKFTLAWEKPAADAALAREFGDII